MRRAGIVILLLATLLLAIPAAAGPPAHHATPWWHYDLTFWAPFDDVRSPLRLLRGTGTLSFTRATPATYVPAGSTTIATAASGQLRIEANGALIEGQRTNLVIYSDNLANAAWVKRGTGAVGATTTGPDGVDNSAYSVSGIGADGIDDIYQAVTVVNTTEYEPSFYIKKITSSGTLRLKLDGFAGVNYVNVNLSLVGSGWERIKRGHPAATYQNSYVSNSTDGYFHFVAPSGGPLSFYLFRNQLEQATFPSSCIPTTDAAVTRHADILTLPAASNISSTVGTISAVAAINASMTSTVVVVTGLNFTGGPLIRRGTPQKLDIDDRTTAVYGDAWGNDGVARKVSSRWDVGDSLMKNAMNGGAVASGAFDGSMNYPASLFIGQDEISGAYGVWGHIKDLRIWNRAFTDAEMQSISR
jgi:hypothetical protein